MPKGNTAGTQFVLEGTAIENASFITRFAPRAGKSLGGGIEIVFEEFNVNLTAFHIPKKVIMFKSNKEFFEFVKTIMDLLKEKGYAEWENRFYSALQISYMPGEVFGGLRLVFQDLQRTGIPDEIGMKKEIDSTLKMLNSILN